MGKKIKTLDSTVPCDIFDKVVIESHQVPTVVLMLDSPEEEIVVKASRALYKFAEKCDENKLTLLTMDLTERFLQLLQSEELKIRQNTCSTIGSMSRHPEARKIFKRIKYLIPAMVQLLMTEYDVVIQEYAALCLSSVAVDFSAKITICAYGGLVPLVNCLGCTDPDVQKNCIETIALMCQDYESKSALREANGLQPILELLKSQYPVVQYQALLALQLASEDSDNRAVLFELGILWYLQEFLSKTENKSLHVFAVMVLSNCLDNERVLTAVKDYGLLQKLIASITDEVPLVEEVKPAAGKKEKAAKDGKKSRIDVAGDTGAPDESKGPADPVILVMPELKEQVANAIALAAKNIGNQKILHEQDVEKKLIALISGVEKPPTQMAAAYALAVLSQHAVSRESIGALAGIPPLIKLSRIDNPDVSEAVAMAFANLTTDNLFNCSEMVNNGGLEPLIAMLSKPRELTIANVTTILNTLASQEEFRSEIVRFNAVPVLVECLRTESSLVQGKVMACLAALLVDQISRSQFMSSGGLDPLVKLVQSNNNIVRMNSSWALSCLANDDAIVPTLCEQGILSLLWEIEKSVTRRNAFSTNAFSKLLDYYPTLLYALTGVLGTHDVIHDEFYDAGRIDDISKLISLEEHSKCPVNQLRPIILVNPKPEKSITEITPQISEVELTEKVGKAGSTGRTSRAGKEPAKPRRSVKDREADKNKEEELQQLADKEAEKSAAAKEAQQFAPYWDSKLFRYVEEAIESVFPLPTSRDQIVALANFVSDKLGGAIKEDEVDNFAWEYDTYQLKEELQSNIIPLGLVRLGFFYHRALLFKFLADKVGIQCTLRRGEYNRAWNEVFIASPETETAKPYIVDVMHRPGRLINVDGCDALEYQTLR